MQSDFNDIEKVMHIDTSCKLYEKKNTGIAYRITKSNIHKGIVLSKKLKKELERDLNVQEDYARMYAIAIYFLIKEDLDQFSVLVICGDENFNYTKRYLDLLFENNSEYSKKKIYSIYELRKITGKDKLKSFADNISRSYRKRALKTLRKRQEGKNLNIVKISYKDINNKWKEIEEKINVSGE